jgi:hypothetical protein
MVKCNQCGRPAIIRVSGHPLCVSCNLQFQQTQELEQNRLINHKNFLLSQMEMVTGLPGTLPRHQVTKQNIFMGNINDIKINNSVVGSVNTGYVQKLNVSLENINRAGAPELASLIKDFIESVLSSELSIQEKSEIVEQVDFVTSEILTPSEKQKPSVLKTLFSNIKGSVSTINGLSTMWNNIHKHLVELL